MRITALRGSAEAAASALAAVRAGVERQRLALEAALARRAEAEAELAGVDPELVPEGSAAEYAAAYDRAQREATDAEAAVGRLRERLHAAERERESLTAQTTALGRALDVRNAAAELVGLGGSGIRGLLGDAVKVTPGYEAAIAAALGPLAEGVLVETRDDAFAVARTVRDGDLGVVDIAIAAADAVSPAFPELAGIIPAREVVVAPEGVLGILSHVVVADDLDAARVAGATLADAELGGRVTIVTRAGEVVHRTHAAVRVGAGSVAPRAGCRAGCRRRTPRRDGRRRRFAPRGARGCRPDSRDVSPAHEDGAVDAARP